MVIGNMNTLIVARAVSAFNQGDYQKALTLYEDAAKKLGAKFFQLNIYLCKRRLDREPVKPMFGSSQLEIHQAPTSIKTICEIDLSKTVVTQIEDLTYINYFHNTGATGLIEKIRNQFSGNTRDQAQELLRVGKILDQAGCKGAEYHLAIGALEAEHSEAILRGFFWVAQRNREFSAACDAIFELEKITNKNPTTNRTQTLAKLKTSPAYLLSALKLIKPRVQSPHDSVSKRLCYILHNSLPYSSGGYGTRSHGVASGLKDSGYEVIVLTRPGFPVDIKPELIESETPEVDVLDGIEYVRTFAPKRPGLSILEYVSKAADAIELKLQKYKPEIVIAASNHVTGLPALIAARRLGIPFIYEVRGLWEITRLSREAEFAEKPAFFIQKLLEAAVAKEADHVFTLTEPMREELVERGVTRAKIDLLPNSCDPSRFVPRKRDEDLAQRLGLPLSIPVIGYIGTFVDYEGLDDLASACALLKLDGIEFRLLLVGNENASGQDRGPITEQIASIAETEGFSDWLIMPGRIPHDEVESYYSLLDVCPFPRKPLPVCEMVSPMKPLEALAMEKAVVVSSVRALVEMIEHERTGLVYEKGNIRSMADTLARLIGDDELRASLGVSGRKWVEESRTWKQIGAKAASVINELVPRDQATKGAAPPQSQVDFLASRDVAQNMLPVWWEQMPEDFRDKSRYMRIEAWDQSGAIKQLRTLYVNHFGEELVNKRIPKLNWGRADICCHLVSSASSVLDIGSGVGEFVNLFATVNPTTSIASVDITDYDLWFDSTGRIDRLYCSIFDINPGEARDIVTCFEVIEHLPPARLVEAISILRTLARKKLFVSVPFMEPLPLYKGHFTRFDSALLSKLFPDARFTIFDKGGKDKSKVLAWVMCEIEFN